MKKDKARPVGMDDVVSLAWKSLNFYKEASRGKKMSTAKELVATFKNSPAIKKAGWDSEPITLVERMLVKTFHIVNQARLKK
ncbi:MAG: hypothetical protein H7Y42_13925 [Chitinophagaceae bacterium]|nr:hypothetical protein [Chitinophagaceae bacterium]